MRPNLPITYDSTTSQLSNPFLCDPIVKSFNTEVIDDSLAKYIKELDDGPIFANLEMALVGKSTITS